MFQTRSLHEIFDGEVINMSFVLSKSHNVNDISHTTASPTANSIGWLDLWPDLILPQGQAFYKVDRLHQGFILMFPLHRFTVSSPSTLNRSFEEMNKLPGSDVRTVSRRFWWESPPQKSSAKSATWICAFIEVITNKRLKIQSSGRQTKTWRD